MDSEAKKQKIEQLKKGLKIGKKVAIVTAKIGAKIGKKVAKESAKATVAAAKAGYKGAQTTYRKYQKMSKNAKRKLHRGLLIAGGALTIAGTTYIYKHGSMEPQNKIEIPADTLNPKLTKVYSITDEASFKQLFEDALPLIQASMIPIEIYKESAYDDRGGANPNSIGIGSFWYPENGDPYSTKWISASKYFKSHPDLKVSFEEALTLVDCWYRTRENGRIYKKMFKELQGAKLTLHQFAACASCTYNSEKMGSDFCKYVRDNYENPVKCAHYLTTLKPQIKHKKPTPLELQIRDGILKRHTGEACLFMYPDYAASVFTFKMKNTTYTDKKGHTKHHTVTSINQTTPAQCEVVRDDLAKGSTKLLQSHKNRIMRYMCKGGYTVADMVNRNIKNEAQKEAMLCLASNQVISYEDQQADNLYAQAIAAYQAEDYAAAMSGFQALRANGYDGADLRCDIALTHYHLGHYDQCIEECRAVLETGEDYLYPRATYNAGKAYEALENYERAKLNYNRSLLMAEKNNIDEKTKAVYLNAVNRMDSIIKSREQREKQIQQKIRQVRKEITAEATDKKNPAKTTNAKAPKKALKTKATSPKTSTKKNTKTKVKPQKMAQSRKRSGR